MLVNWRWWSTGLGLLTGGGSTGLASEGGVVFGGWGGGDADGGDST